MFTLDALLAFFWLLMVSVQAILLYRALLEIREKKIMLEETFEQYKLALDKAYDILMGSECSRCKSSCSSPKEQLLLEHDEQH